MLQAHGWHEIPAETKRVAQAAFPNGNLVIKMQEELGMVYPVAPKRETKEYLWGYGTGLCIARDTTYGECVLAEPTLSFNVHDSQYYLPLMGTTRTCLARTPARVMADAAYDAWWIYQDTHAGGGTA